MEDGRWKMEKNKIISCPNCNEYIIIEKLNCGIFRHGIMKKNGKWINQHSTKKYIDKLMKKNLIYGCGKPFQIIIDNENIEIKICDYI